MAKPSSKLTLYWTGILIFYTLDSLVTVAAQRSTAVRRTGKTCYTSQAWLSCLLNPCSFSVCPSFPEAQCWPTKTPCDGCRAQWYFNRRRVNCHARPTTCPPSVPIVECSINPCLSQRCSDPAFEVAACRPSYCGTCHAEYFVNNQWRVCSRPGTVGSVPLDAVVRQFDSVPAPASRCAPGVQEDATCTDEICLSQSCPTFPDAVCRPDACGQCRANWYVGSQLVDCNTRNCPAGVPEIRCVDNPCKYFQCRRYPKAECRQNNCGSCKADFYVNNTIVDCDQPGPACSDGTEPVTCPANTCRVSICPVNIKAMCRVNSCGGCVPEYYVDGKVVPCEGWWSHNYKKKQFAPDSANSTLPNKTPVVPRVPATPPINPGPPIISPELSTEPIPDALQGVLRPMALPDVPEPLPAGLQINAVVPPKITTIKPSRPLLPGPDPVFPPGAPVREPSQNFGNPLLPGSVPAPPPQFPVRPPFRNTQVNPNGPLLPGSVPAPPPRAPIQPPFRNTQMNPNGPLLPGSVPAPLPQAPVRRPFPNTQVNPNSLLRPESVPAPPPQAPVRPPFRNTQMNPNGPLLPGSVPAPPPQAPVRRPFPNTPVNPNSPLRPESVPAPPPQAPVRPPFPNTQVNPNSPLRPGSVPAPPSQVRPPLPNNQGPSPQRPNVSNFPQRSNNNQNFNVPVISSRPSVALAPSIFDLFTNPSFSSRQQRRRGQRGRGD